MQIASGRVRRKTEPTGPGVEAVVVSKIDALWYTAKPNLPGRGLEYVRFFLPLNIHLGSGVSGVNWYIKRALICVAGCGGCHIKSVGPVFVWKQPVLILGSN